MSSPSLNHTDESFQNFLKVLSVSNRLRPPYVKEKRELQEKLKV